MYPYERLVLLGLAAARAELTFWFPAAVSGLFAIALWRVGAKRLVIAVAASLLATGLAIGTAFVSADVIEHYARRWLLGYSYNPYVSAIGEWEGWMGPTSPDGAAAWHRTKCGPPPHETPWWGDPASGSFCR